MASPLHQRCGHGKQRDTQARAARLRQLPTTTIIVLSLLFISGCRENSGGLRIDPASLELGDVTPSDDAIVTAPVTIYNDGADTIEIVRFVTSCNCTELRPSNVTLGAGESGKITLLINVGGGLGPLEQAHKSPFSVTVAPVSHKASFPSFQVRGVVKRYVACSPAHIDFGECIDGIAISEKQLTVQTLMPNVRLLMDSPHGVVARMNPSTHPGEYTITLALSTPNVTVRRELVDQLVLTPVLDNEPVLPKYSIPITASFMTDLSVYPSSLSLGTVDDNATRQIKIVSRTGKRWTLDTAYKNDGVELKTVPSDEPASQLCIQAHFNFPTSASNVAIREGTLQLRFRDTNDNHALVNIPWCAVSRIQQSVEHTHESPKALDRF